MATEETGVWVLQICQGCIADHSVAVDTDQKLILDSEEPSWLTPTIITHTSARDVMSLALVCGVAEDVRGSKANKIRNCSGISNCKNLVFQRGGL